MRVLLVCNPASGSGRARRLEPAVLERLRGTGLEVEAHRTTSLADAGQAAEEAAGVVDAVVALGGDGVVGACADGLARAAGPARAALGIVPAGGGNDGAACLGLPTRDPLAAAGLVASLQPRPVDLARVGDRHYLCIAGAGFDSEVNRLANTRLAWAPGQVRYVGALLAELGLGRPAGFTLELDGRPHHTRAWFVVVANGRSYGRGMRIAPTARLDDGLLDVIVVGAMSRLTLLGNFPKVYSGRHLAHPAVSAFQAARVRLAADRPLEAYADGEYVGSLPVTVEAVPAAIRVLAPAAAPGPP